MSDDAERKADIQRPEFIILMSEQSFFILVKEFEICEGMYQAGLQRRAIVSELGKDELDNERRTIHFPLIET